MASYERDPSAMDPRRLNAGTIGIIAAIAVLGLIIVTVGVVYLHSHGGKIVAETRSAVAQIEKAPPASAQPTPTTGAPGQPAPPGTGN
jgi:hypothetical protein